MFNKSELAAILRHCICLQQDGQYLQDYAEILSGRSRTGLVDICDQ